MYYVFLTSPPGINTYLRSYQEPVDVEKELEVPCGYNGRVAVFRFLEQKPRTKAEDTNLYFAFHRFKEDTHGLYGC